MGGRKLGNLVNVNGIVLYGLSPQEQRIFKGFWKDSAQGILRRCRRTWYIFPVFAGLYAVTRWMNATNLALTRKNPTDYANDE